MSDLFDPLLCLRICTLRERKRKATEDGILEEFCSSAWSAFSLDLSKATPEKQRREQGDTNADLGRQFNALQYTQYTLPKTFLPTETKAELRPQLGKNNNTVGLRTC